MVSASADGADTDSLMNDAAAAQQRRAKSAKRRQRQQEQQQAQQQGQEASADPGSGSQLQGGRPLSLSQQQEALFEGKYGLPVSCATQSHGFVRAQQHPWQCKRLPHLLGGTSPHQSTALTSGGCPTVDEIGAALGRWCGGTCGTRSCCGTSGRRRCRSCCSSRSPTPCTLRASAWSPTGEGCCSMPPVCLCGALPSAAGSSCTTER